VVEKRPQPKKTTVSKYAAQSTPKDEQKPETTKNEGGFSVI
jgi:hypothetical protein